VRVRRLAETAGIIALAGALLAGAVRVEAVREARYSSGDTDEPSLYVRSNVAVRRLSGSYPTLAADLYWIRAIQYYGGTKQRLAGQQAGPEVPPMLADTPQHGYDLLYPLLDLATTLDPRFNIAYRFGAVFLAEAFPRGAGQPDLAIALLQKGLAVRPDKWEYMEDIGFVHYWYRHDFRSAAEWFQKASEVPDAPWWLRSLAATTLAQGGDRRSSRAMWEAIRASAEIDWLRKDAERRLAQLRALDDIDLLQRRVDDFTRRTGQPPPTWTVLVRAGMLPGTPADPARAPYELTDGHVRLSRSSPLWPMPVEPGDSRTPPS